MKTIEQTSKGHRVVSQQEWIAARKELLKKEKESSRLRDQLSAERRALPWVKVEKNYAFDAPEGRVTLGDLFDGRSQLFVKHFMLGPGWKRDASVARSRWIISKVRWCISNITT